MGIATTPAFGTTVEVGTAFSEHPLVRTVHWPSSAESIPRAVLDRAGQAAAEVGGRGVANNAAPLWPAEPQPLVAAPTREHLRVLPPPLVVAPAVHGPLVAGPGPMGLIGMAQPPMVARRIAHRLTIRPGPAHSAGIEPLPPPAMHGADTALRLTPATGTALKLTLAMGTALKAMPRRGIRPRQAALTEDIMEAMEAVLTAADAASQ